MSLCRALACRLLGLRVLVVRPGDIVIVEDPHHDLRSYEEEGLAELVARRGAALVLLHGTVRFSLLAFPSLHPVTEIPTDA